MNTAPKVQVRRLMQQAEKYKNERHHTYATFLFRDVRQVSQLTRKSNVTKKVHESGMTSCTAQKRATGLRNHTSVKQRTRSKSSRHGMYRTTVTKSRYTVGNSPHTSMIPITQGGGVHSTCLTWNVSRKHVVQLISLLHAHNIARCQHKLHLRKS